MTNVEMGKKYTLQGHRGTVKYIDGKYDYRPVLWERERDGMPFLLTLSGKCLESGDCLVEISPYSAIAIDAPGWARDAGEKWYPRHFAGISESGKPMAWENGATSHTAGKTCVRSWDEFTTTKPEGLLS